MWYNPAMTVIKHQPNMQQLTAAGRVDSCVKSYFENPWEIIKGA